MEVLKNILHKFKKAVDLEEIFWIGKNNLKFKQEPNWRKILNRFAQ